MSASLSTLELQTWAKEIGVLDTLLYCFEDGDIDKVNFVDWHLSSYGKRPRFLVKNEANPLQAVGVG